MILKIPDIRLEQIEDIDPEIDIRCCFLVPNVELRDEVSKTRTDVYRLVLFPNENNDWLLFKLLVSTHYGYGG